MEKKMNKAGEVLGSKKFKRFFHKARVYWKENKRYAFNYVCNRIGSVFLHLIGHYKAEDRKNEEAYKKLLMRKKDIIFNMDYGKGIKSKIVLPVKDKGLSVELTRKGIREPLHVEWMHKLLKPRMTVVDIGANLGYYLLMEAKIVNKVYGIEPNPASFAYLRRSVKLNKLKNVKLFNIGAGDKKTILPFHISCGWNWSRFQLRKGGRNDDIEKDIMMKINTLDNLFKGKKIDLVRMDTEGYEINIIKGMKQIIKENPILIVMEFHSNEFGNEERKEFVDFLTKNNFKIKYMAKPTNYMGKPNVKKTLENVPLNRLLSIFGNYYIVLEKK